MREPPLMRPPLIKEPPLAEDGLEVGMCHDLSLALPELELPRPESEMKTGSREVLIS